MDKHLQKQFLESGLLDGIKTQEELVKLLNELHASALEALLHGELEAHLGYAKHQKSDNTNARNGTTPKQIKTTFGKSEMLPDM